MALGKHDIRTAQRCELDADGMPGVQCDRYGPNAGGPPDEMHHQYGFLSMPGDPDDDGRGCQMHFFEEGSRTHCSPSYDPRALEKLPRFKPRSVTQHSYYGGFDTFTGKDGSKQVYVPFAFVDGVATKAHVFEMRVDGDITLRHASGAGIALTDTSTILNSPDGSCSIEIANDGSITLNGNLKINGSISGPGGLPFMTAAMVPAIGAGGFP